MFNKIGFIPFVAILSIVFLEVLAISNGIDGKVLTIAIGGIAAIGGYKFGKRKTNS